MRLAPTLVPIVTHLVAPYAPEDDRRANDVSFYKTAAWRKLSAEVIRERGHKCEQPGCMTPKENGRTIGRLHVDHIRELSEDGARFDKRNLLVRCVPCHNQKTASRAKLRAQHRYG